MNEAELIQEFIRVDTAEGALLVWVQTITWEGPHTPVCTWIIARRLNRAATVSEIQAAIRSVLNDARWFNSCQECTERNPVGWMLSDNLCQRCAQQNLGVVF